MYYTDKRQHLIIVLNVIITLGLMILSGQYMLNNHLFYFTASILAALVVMACILERYILFSKGLALQQLVMADPEEQYRCCQDDFTRNNLAKFLADINDEPVIVSPGRIVYDYYMSVGNKKIEVTLSEADQIEIVNIV